MRYTTKPWSKGNIFFFTWDILRMLCCRLKSHDDFRASDSDKLKLATSQQKQDQQVSKQMIVKIVTAPFLIAWNPLWSYLIIECQQVFSAHIASIYSFTRRVLNITARRQRWIFMVCDFHSIRTATVWKQRGDMNAPLSLSPLLYSLKPELYTNLPSTPFLVKFFFYSSDSLFFLFFPKALYDSDSADAEVWLSTVQFEFKVTFEKWACCILQQYLPDWKDNRLCLRFWDLRVRGWVKKKKSLKLKTLE